MRQRGRAFTLLDDTGFDLNGNARINERLTQYSAAWLLRRDQNNNRGTVNLTVVVYFNRPIGSASDEPTFRSYADPGISSPTCAASRSRSAGEPRSS